MPHRGQFHVDPGIRHSVLGRIVIQVLDDAPEPPAVRHDHHRLLRHIHHQLQTFILKFFTEFAVGLLNQLLEIKAVQLQLHIAGADFRRFHQVVGQMLQAHGLILQNRDIILRPIILDILPFQQIHVIDN